jgi:hypothetical protein
MMANISVKMVMVYRLLNYKKYIPVDFVIISSELVML